ncbi:MAG TPA: YggS family pyridoxal phosphate-dependent enzyme [Sandaracinaceae bacterium LLY-WYZ-13_1]|nr:YggS family pyridoxal phosphate-dependent enzyme [Sandaracinaceae bacterium LLY-WYZ-13_1]
MSRVADGLAAVRGRIARACARAGRDPASVRLVAVSKRHPPEAIREAFGAGQRLFGENYVQELMDKAEALEGLGALRWHFVGHLQRNKAKHVARIGAFVETVDSPRLARALDKRAAHEGITLPVLLQVNVAGEARKSGCALDALDDLVAEARACEGLDVRGLMTIPPFADDPEAARPHFARLRALAATHGLPELSMGMSGDLEVAVEEGATIVRVGTAIFGPRPG